MRCIDLNSDMGESFGAWRMGSDEEIMQFITTANVACGYHAGDPLVMERTVQLAKEYGVAVGAHPGLPDLMGFGRRRLSITRDEARAYTLYQVGALRAILDAQGLTLHHVKPHGAFYLMCAENEEVARGFCEAVARMDPTPMIYFPAPLSTHLPRIARDEFGLRVVGELYIDMDYDHRGVLVVRRHWNNLNIDDVVARAVRFFKEGKIRSIEGTDLEFEAESICIHGDNPYAVEILRSLRAALMSEGFEIAPVAS